MMKRRFVRSGTLGSDDNRVWAAKGLFFATVSRATLSRKDVLDATLKQEEYARGNREGHQAG